MLMNNNNKKATERHWMIGKKLLNYSSLCTLKMSKKKIKSETCR